MIRWVTIAIAISLWLNAAIGFSQKVSNDKDLIARSTDRVWVEQELEQPAHSKTLRNSIDVSDRHRAIATPTTAKRPDWLQSIFDFLKDVFEIVVHLWLYILLIGALFVVGAVLFFVYRDTWQSSHARRRRRNQKLANEAAKIQDLPFEIEASRLGLFEQSMRYRELRDYSKAIIYLFSHVLVELDGARCIRLERGKTNRRYLRELGGESSLKSFTEQLIHAFEYSFFGKHALTQDAFESLWCQLPEFQKSIAKSMAENTSSMKLKSSGAG